MAVGGKMPQTNPLVGLSAADAAAVSAAENQISSEQVAAQASINQQQASAQATIDANTAVAQATIDANNHAVSAAADTVTGATNQLNAAITAFNGQATQSQLLQNNSGSSSTQGTYQDSTPVPTSDNTMLYAGAVALYLLLKGKILHGLI